jgi:hypothetical protein
MKFVLSAPVSRSLALIVLTIFAFNFPAQVAFAQAAPTAKSFEGVWKITKVVDAGGTDTNPQPSLQIFSRGYFSVIRINGSGARQPSPAPKDPSQLTDEEKIARYAEWAPYGASAGTYEVRGNTLITHAIIAKNVEAMTVGATEEATFKFEGNTFVATSKVASTIGRQTTYTRVR